MSSAIAEPELSPLGVLSTIGFSLDDLNTTLSCLTKHNNC